MGDVAVRVDAMSLTWIKLPKNPRSGSDCYADLPDGKRYYVKRIGAKGRDGHHVVRLNGEIVERFEKVVDAKAFVEQKAGE